MIDLYTDENITREELDRRLHELRKRQENQSQEIKQREHDQLADMAFQEAESQLEELAQMVQAKLSTAAWSWKREQCMLLVKRIGIHDKEIKITLKAPQLPFVNSPDGNRGFLQHRLPCVAQAGGAGGLGNASAHTQNDRTNGPAVW